MNLKTWIQISLLILAGLPLSGQHPALVEIEQQLAYHADVMVNASEARHRIKAMEAFNPLFDQALNMSGAFDYPFDSLKWISIKMPSDKSFKLYSWEVNVGNGNYRYFGLIQKKDGTIFHLTDDFKNATNLRNEEFSSDNWLGAVYYNLMEGKTSNGQQYYMLFGVHHWNAFENIKLIDILFFSDEGLPYFGLPVFKMNEGDGKSDLYNRLVFKYAADGQMTVNYNPGMQLIMVDNLVKRMSRIPGQGETMVPDGTYVGYQLKKDIWERIDKIAIEPMESAPRPKPILDSRKGNNLFGDKKSKNQHK
ncbi:MAG: hypothetical protein J5I52_01245 [Saprospiraceae bacterium]|nr:MAG: hypothetical protein UZ09_BCD002002152 [Bacteroidetes bacterium OLB9]MCO6462751.1 hypothetical protein [Saprospiraceae bacterium]MCZ2339035.1 hypothetical protein [Chitinophagales bacterium]